MLRESANKSTVDLKQEILKPFYYMQNVKSHIIVSKDLPQAMNYWIKAPSHKLNEISKLVETMINSILMLDDIQDQSLMRRHLPTAHCLFGTNLTINASILGTCHLMKDALNLGHEDAIGIVINTMIEFLTGQGVDIYWRENLMRPTEQDYKWMVERKSVTVLLIPILLMQLFSDDKRDYSKLINMIATFYQIRDDYCNLVDHEALEGKSRRDEIQNADENNFCDDFSEGKRSFPIIHAMQTSPENAFTLESILKQRTRNIGLKKYCLSIVKSTGSLQYTLDVLRKMNADIRDEIKRLGGNAKLEAWLDNVSL